MFAQLLLQAVSGVVSSQLAELLKKFKELNGEEKYNQLREAIRNSFLLLQTVTDKTKTKIDDTAVAMILNAVEQN
jgi:hypothetical protein